MKIMLAIAIMAISTVSLANEECYATGENCRRTEVTVKQGSAQALYNALNMKGEVVDTNRGPGVALTMKAIDGLFCSKLDTPQAPPFYRCEINLVGIDPKELYQNLTVGNVVVSGQRTIYIYTKNVSHLSCRKVVASNGRGLERFSCKVVL